MKSEVRECYACGSNETTIHRTPKGTAYGAWYGNGNEIDDQWLCERCENHLVKGPKFHPLTNPRRNKKYYTCNYDHIVKPSRHGVVDNHFERSEPIYCLQDKPKEVKIRNGTSIRK
jgi:hypothetical protein